jgi:hypothetical protein
MQQVGSARSSLGKKEFLGLALALALANFALLGVAAGPLNAGSGEWDGSCGYHGGGDPPQCICYDDVFMECDRGATATEQIERCADYLPGTCSPPIE